MKIPETHDSPDEMNVRQVHGAIWREFSEPIERWRRAPWYLRHSYVMMLIFALVYLLIQKYDWNEYEEDSILRQRRDLEIIEQKERQNP